MVLSSTCDAIKAKELFSNNNLIKYEGHFMVSRKCDFVYSALLGNKDFFKVNVPDCLKNEFSIIKFTNVVTFQSIYHLT